MRSALLAALACACALSSGCTNTSTCSRDPDFLTVPLDGSSGSAVEGNTYHSAPFGGPYTYFPPFRTATFEHGLGEIPYNLQFWLAFSPNGTLAPSAGNMTELRNPDDGGAPALNAQTISVYNNTCSDFYVWVVASRPSP